MEALKKGTEFRFREIYGKYIHILNEKEANDLITPVKTNNEEVRFFDYNGRVNSIFAYCYVDHTAGLSFLVLSVGLYENGETRYLNTRENKLIVLRKAIFDNSMCTVFDDNSELEEDYGDFARGFAGKYTSPHLDNLRKMQIIDPYRDDTYPDDVLVYFIREDIEPEAMWVRLEEDNDTYMTGRLLNEPKQDIGYNINDRIDCYLAEIESNNIIILADLECKK